MLGGGFDGSTCLGESKGLCIDDSRFIPETIILSVPGREFEIRIVRHVALLIETHDGLWFFQSSFWHSGIQNSSSHYEKGAS